MKSYFFEIFLTLYLHTGLFDSSLCSNRTIIVECMVVYIGRLTDSFLFTFMNNASMNIVMHTAFICCCLILFHRIDSQKCSYWMRGVGYFKALNIYIVNLCVFMYYVFWKNYMDLYLTEIYTFYPTFVALGIFIIFSSCQFHCKKLYLI